MKKALAIAAALTAFGVTQVAHAQAKNFEGFSVGANVEFDGGSSSASDGTSDNGSSTGVGLQARYDWAFGRNFVLGVGGTYGTGNRQAGTYASGAGVYTSNRYSLDLTPGYALTDNLLLYGKVSSLSASAAADDGSGNSSVQGVGYGIGMRGLLNRHVYWQAGLDSYRYNDVTFGSGTTASLKNTAFTLGAGYKF